MNLRNAQYTILSAIAFLAISAALTIAQTQRPAATITAIDNQTGVVTAKVKTTGQTFDFRLNNPAQTSQLRVGEGVYPNFKTDQVSLDGRTAAGTITRRGESLRPNGAALVNGSRPNEALRPSDIRSSLRQVTIAPNPADSTGRTALLNLRLEPTNGNLLPNSLCASLNGEAIDLVDRNQDGNYTGRLQLAEHFPYQEPVSFDSNGQELTPHKASAGGGLHWGGECHTVPCPPGCKSPLGADCVVCISCSVTFGVPKPTAQASRGSSK